MQMWRDDPLLLSTSKVVPVKLEGNRVCVSCDERDVAEARDKKGLQVPSTDAINGRNEPLVNDSPKNK